MAMSLILLPGLDGTGLLFEPLVAALPPTLKPTIVRYPGDRPLSYAELFLFIMEAIPQSEPFIIMGESFSGPLAVMVAGAAPRNLRGVIFCATFITPPWPSLRSIVPIVARPLTFRFYLPFKRLKAWVGGYSTQQHRARLAEMARLVRPAVIAARVRMVFQVDVRNECAACAVPILYLQGERDLVVPAESLRTIQKIKPSVQVIRLDAPHMVLQNKPNQSVEAIAAFVSSVEAD